MKTNVDFVEGDTRRLDELPAGCDAVVVGLEDSSPIDRRLMDLGLIPGTPVRLLRRAPLGDPAVYVLRGYQLCLRKAEAARIRVRILPGEIQPGETQSGETQSGETQSGENPSGRATG